MSVAFGHLEYRAFVQVFLGTQQLEFGGLPQVTQIQAFNPFDISPDV